jgi:hypothetical protein
MAKRFSVFLSDEDIAILGDVNGRELVDMAKGAVTKSGEGVLHNIYNLMYKIYNEAEDRRTQRAQASDEVREMIIKNAERKFIR